MKMNVVVRFQLPGVHCWPEAAGPVIYLTQKHRHLFYFECVAPVNHDNRDLEFMTIQNEIKEFLILKYWQSGLLFLNTLSCEQLALVILEKFQYLSKVSIFEDNENGAEVFR